MFRKLYNRFFVCPKRGHVAPWIKGEEYGGPPSDHCMNCGGYIYERKWRNANH